MKFGKIKMPEWALWLAGLGIPAAVATVYHYFHADPTDIVTDVQYMGTGATGLTILYNAGPQDNVVIPMGWNVLGQPMTINATKLALVGTNRDRVGAWLASVGLTKS